MTNVENLSRYKKGLLNCVDNVSHDTSKEKYRVTCSYCGKVFESRVLEKALNREGVHRSKEHTTDGSITMSKGERDKDFSLLDTWESIEKDRTVIDLIWWTTPTQVMKKRLSTSKLLNRFNIHYNPKKSRKTDNVSHLQT